MSELIRPDDRLKVTLQSGERELFMSMTRLNACVRLVGDVGSVPGMMVDPDLSELAVKTMLAPKAEDAYALELAEDEIGPDAWDAVLLWVQDHLLYFFTKRSQQMAAQATKLGPMAAALKSSLHGSKDSNSSEPSAGLSEPSPVG